MKKRILSLLLTIAMILSAIPLNTYAASNVYNVTQNRWYDTLSAATAEATDGNVIEVHNSFTETTSVKIRKQNLTIRAASGKNPTISWTTTDSVPVSGATPYHCVVIYTDVTTSTTFGGGTGCLTFDASKASDNDNKGTRARVMVHCGKGAVLNIQDGIVLTGGNPGGGSYTDNKDAGKFPSWSGEIAGEVGFGAGLFMRFGTLNMSGGVIKNNNSLWGSTTDHNYVGGGSGVYLYGTSSGTEYTTMNMTGGTITHNAAGSGGGGGILVGFNSKLNMSGGTISENVCNFASGGGIGVRTNSEVTISGGLIKDNKVEGHGGGLFARGDSIPLRITGGVFENNTAGSYGGGILFWTVGDDVTKNTVIIGGDVQIKNNHALDGAGISVGREVLDGKPIGNKAKLVIEGNPIISDNIASRNGGGIHMQSDEFSKAVNTVEISGGTFSNNEAEKGAGIYVPGGIVTLTGGTFNDNKASINGAGIFTGGGTMTISNAIFSKNIAFGNGGGAFVQSGNIIMNSGAFTGNNAQNGGAVYIASETITNDNGSTSKVSGTAAINGGIIEQNIAASNGGAFYVEGAITMTDGTVQKNEAVDNGGALYVTGGNFTMTSGYMIENKATGSTSNGGGAYVEGGSIVIGEKGCNGEESNHSVNPTDKIHPIIQKNSATDSGGGLALVGNGSITMHCGNITDNEATNRGRGLNIYMENGTFDYYKGDVGKLDNPELVIVGGSLVNHNLTKGNVTLKYYHCNIAGDVTNHTSEKGQDDKIATASKEAWFNLPDGEKYWDAAEGYRFFGWTFNGPNSQAANSFVRDKSQYQPLGSPIQALDKYDETQDDTIHMYALWAPEISSITYVGSRVDGVFIKEDLSATSNPTQYSFDTAKYVIDLVAPEKAGYKLEGWYIYQNEEQNANWGFEYNPVTTDNNPVTSDYSNLKFDELVYLPITSDDGSYRLTIAATNFGDITLVANWVSATADLTIEKVVNGAIEDNQSFVFNITGIPSDSKLDRLNMTVTIQGTGSIILKDLPVGEYKISELTDWSWRYTLDHAVISDNPNAQITNNEVDISLLKHGSDKKVTFTNTLSENKWLSSNSYCKNWYGPNGINQ